MSCCWGLFLWVFVGEGVVVGGGLLIGGRLK